MAQHMYAEHDFESFTTFSLTSYGFVCIMQFPSFPFPTRQQQTWAYRVIESHLMKLHGKQCYSKKIKTFIISIHSSSSKWQFKFSTFCDKIFIKHRFYHIFNFRSYATVQTQLLRYLVIQDRTIHHIVQTTIRRSVIHCQTQPSHRKTWAMKFAFRTCWLAQNTTFGCTIPTPRITTCSLGPFPSPPVSLRRNKQTNA